jgi:hypothetical protein
MKVAKLIEILQKCDPEATVEEGVTGLVFDSACYHAGQKRVSLDTVTENEEPVDLFHGWILLYKSA